MPFDDAGQLVSLPLTPRRQAALMEQVRAHYDEGMTARGDWPTRHEKRYRRYLADRQLRGRGPWLNAPRIFTPDTQNVVEKIWSQLWTGVFPRFEALDMDPFDEAALPHLATALATERWALRYLINDADQGGFAHISRMAIFDSLLDSAGYLKVYPWRQPWRDARPERLIRMDNVDEGMLTIPPGATGLQYPEAAYVGQDVYVRWDDLRRMQREGYTIPKKDEFAAEPKALTERQRAEQERDGRVAEHDSDQYLVNEMYCRFAVEHEDDEEDEVIVSWYPHAGDTQQFGRAILLKDRFPYLDRPHRPFFPIVIWQQPRQLRGLNAVDKIEQMQDLVNRLTEQMVAYGDITLSPMFVYNAMLTGDIPDLTQVMPGQGVPVNDLSGVQFVPRPSLNRHFLEQLTEHRIGIERTTSVSDATQGIGPTRPNAPRTASGTAMLQQASRQAFSILVGLLAYQFQAPLQFHWQLMQHYAPPGLRVPLTRVASPQGQGPSAPPGVPSGIGSDAQALALPGLPGQGGTAPPAPASGLLAFPGQQAEAQAEDLLNPEEAFLIAKDVSRDDLQGTFLVKLKVNPDLPFDRQVLTQLGQTLYPVLAQKYPLGARLLLKRIWEINNQSGFDTLYPPSIALLETQALFTQILQQQQAQQAQTTSSPSPQGAPPLPPAVQALQHAHAASAAQHGMAQHGHQTQASAAQAQRAQVQLAQAIQKLMQHGQPKEDSGA